MPGLVRSFHGPRIVADLAVKKETVRKIYLMRINVCNVDKEVYAYVRINQNDALPLSKKIRKPE